MTDLHRLAGGPAGLSLRRAAEPAFPYRDTAEIERQLPVWPNRRSFTGIERKLNANWAAARIGVLHRGMGAVRNASWGRVGEAGRA